jgi:cytochrome c553
MAQTRMAAACVVACTHRHNQRPAPAAAQPAPYLERELRNYRSRARRSEAMSVTARTLSDDDIRHLAVHYTAIRIEMRGVPQ